MESCEKRKISELLVLYFLEPELDDIYVEGVSDKCALNRFIHFNKCNVKIIEISDIDFTELYTDKPYLKSNCKKKLLELSQQLEIKFNNTRKGIVCIVDRDFDDFLDAILINSYLHYTDFSSIELYFFNENSLDTFFKHVLHEFPFESKHVLLQIQPVLNTLFNIKLSLKTTFGNDFEVNDFDFQKLIKINKADGTIVFNHNEYILRYLNSKGLMSHRISIEEGFTKFSQQSDCDNKLKIRGHDFIVLFYIYINKIKNSININLETLERVVFLCIDLEYVSDYSLFKTIKQKYIIKS